MPENTKVFNDDVAGIYRRFNRFIVEVQKSASANVADINAFDLERINAYIQSMTFYLDWVDAQPMLDLPETHPKLISLEAVPVVIEVENLMIRDLVRLFERARDEIVNAQSARNASGLIKFDSARVRAVLQKATNYLEEYVVKVSPLDMPESSPTSTDSGSGAGGINP